MKTFKPMLAATCSGIDDWNNLSFPFMASAKLDGIRAIVKDGVLVSRNLKPIPNKFVRDTFSIPLLEGFDGELIFGPPNAKDTFRATTSAVMSHEGRPDVKFYIFDRVDSWTNPKLSYFDRYMAYSTSQIRRHPVGRYVVFHEQRKVENLLDLDAFENECIKDEYEGVILRSAKQSYKFGRSTLNEEKLIKIKRFSDAEAKIVGFEEQWMNTNTATKNALGHTERSSKQDGLVGKGTLGALNVVGINGDFKDVEFSIGTGLDDKIRNEIWSNRKKWMNKIIKYKYFSVGTLDRPRFPVFLGERMKGDL